MGKIIANIQMPRALRSPACVSDGVGTVIMPSSGNSAAAGCALDERRAATVFFL